MDFLPVFMRVKDRPVAVVGGGIMAARKAELALAAGAKVTVFAKDLSPSLARRRDAGELRHEAREPAAADFAAVVLVLAGDEDQAINERAHALAMAKGVPVNVVDRPELCTFILPAVVDRSPLLVAVSSGGAVPLLTRMLKARLEALVPGAYGRLARFAAAYRDRVKQGIPIAAARRRFWERIVAGPVAEQLFAGQNEAAHDLMEKTLAEAEKGGVDDRGEVYLVGCGPGDPDLVTFRALRLMQQADVVLYDRLVSDPILNLVRRDAERVFVGKQPGDHVVPQEEISRLLVRLAQEGKRVLRLKGGDPFIFGRGGEEIEMLAEHGVPFQVVPGITAATGCATYAGIPLTHRDHAQACVFVTGHSKNGVLDIDWETLLRPHQTVVVYMGMNAIALLTDGMRAKGADPKLPIAVVENGTRENQRVVVGTLVDIEAKAKAERIGGPALLIIGTVVSLRGKFDWFAAADRARADSAYRPDAVFAVDPLPGVAAGGGKTGDNDDDADAESRAPADV